MTAFIAVAFALALAASAILLVSLRRSGPAARASWDELNAAVYRDQLVELDAALAQGGISAAQHALARDAIRRRLAEDLRPATAASGSRASGKAMGWGIAAALPLAAAALYAVLGTPAALSPQPAAARDDSAHGLQSEQIAVMVGQLGARLAQSPEDVPGWVMLGRSYSALGRFPEASRAYGEAARRAPGDAQLLADYADVLAMSQGRSFEGEPDRLIAAALQAGPANIKALALGGTSAFARKDYPSAAALWIRIRDQVPPDSEMGRSIAMSIAQAQSLGGGGSGGAAVKPAPGTASFVAGVVKISPELAARAAPGDTLFVFARGEGGRAPVAMLRLRAGDLPAAFRLDDSRSMSPANPLSAQPSVIVGARVSRSGNALAQPGDLEATLGPVALGSGQLVLEITKVLP